MITAAHKASTPDRTYAPSPSRRRDASRRSPVAVGARVVSRIAALLCLASLAGPATPAGAVVSPSVDPSIETNGDVNAVVSSGGRLFLGGVFTRAGLATGGGADLARSDGSANHASARPNSNVNTVVSDGAGGWYIGGAFQRVGTVARNRIAHLLADGSVDPNFDPNVNGNVSTLLLSGTTLYAGGNFSTVNGTVARGRLAAFNTATGAVTSFNANIATSQVQSLAMSGDILYVGGGFTTLGSPAVTRNRLAAFDTTTGALTSFDPNMSGAVTALAVAGTTLYAGGGFTTVNGSVTRNRLAALDTTTGTALAAFNPNMDNSVTSLAVAGGTVYATGTFGTVNGGVPRQGVAAVDAGSGVATAFNAGLPALAPAQSLAVADGTVYVGGAFATVNGGVPRNNIAAFSATDGSVVPGFDPNVDAAVNTIAVAGSRLYAGGSFTFAGAETVHSRLAAVNADGTIDAGFHASADNTVFALAVSGSKLYAGGNFTTVNDTVTRNRLAAFDPATGAVEPAFDANVGGTVNALALSATKLYAGGGFTTVNGTVTRNRLAAFDPATGAVDPAFDPNMNNTTSALALAGGTLYAGGSFTIVNDTTVLNRLAALDATTGTVDPTFNPNVDGSVTSLLAAAGTLYAGGSFATVNGSVARNRLAAFDGTTGTVDPAFNPNVNNSVGALALAGGTLYAGGSFTAVNGTVARSRLAALDAGTGAVDPTFNPLLSANVNALSASASRLYAGGTFTTIGPDPQRRFAQFSQAPSAPSVLSGAASSIADTSATVAATINPNAATTSYVVEYGPSLSFGQISTPASIGAGTTGVPVSAGLSGLTANTTYYYRAVATNSVGTAFGTVRSFKTTGGIPAPPIANTQAATGTGTSSTVLHGQVNPNGQQTAYTFEYGTSTSFGSITPVVALDDADALEPVSATLSGLAPDTTYYYRLVATNATGTTLGAVMTVTTGPGGAPIVATGDASAVTATSATLAGTVDPHGASTAFAFEYGTTTSFGSLSPVDNAGSAPGSQAITLPITGLQPGTTYLYRVIATNPNATTTGTVHSFTTPAAA
jgi:trimeric autotransporter adhesin